MCLMAISRAQPFPIPSTPAPGPWKAADLERFPEDGYQYEIWHGELVRMAPAGGRHGECEANLVTALHQQTRGLGRVYTGDTGFLLHEDPDELVSPDVAFVRLERLPPPAERVSYLRVVPDLAIEIRSPSETDAEVQAKVALYLRTGVQLVWLVDPRQQTIDEVRPSTAASPGTKRLRAEAGDVLKAEAVVPGFRLPLSEVFA